MKYLFAGSQSPERLELLLSETKISSEDIKAALYDHLVLGYEVSRAAIRNKVAQQNVDRAIDRLESMASMIEAVKEHDANKFSVKWCKCHNEINHK